MAGSNQPLICVKSTANLQTTMTLMAFMLCCASVAAHDRRAPEDCNQMLRRSR
jgi:hypothetical protein